VKKKIRAIQYGVGPIGASIAKLMREKQALEICGAIDTDPAKVGRDLGDVVGAADAPWGVTISADAQDVLQQAADVVIHSTSSALPKVMDQLIACLEAESCVVSTCEELSYPYRTYPELSAKLDATAKDWGVALVGTGVNPGFVMDKLVITETIEPMVAQERVQTEFLTVEPGQAAGVHQIARGLCGGKELVYLELQMYVGAKDPADKIELTGHPHISLVIPGGSHGDIATASVVVNSIPAILNAPAGLRTSRDLPIGFFAPNARP
jgi:hypothetical protein